MWLSTGPLFCTRQWVLDGYDNILGGRQPKWLLAFKEVSQSNESLSQTIGLLELSFKKSLV